MVENGCEYLYWRKQALVRGNSASEFDPKPPFKEL
jgi:hypothetical protein